MAGISRFDSSAATSEELAFKGAFPNGQRVNLMSAKLDRFGSFREGNEGRMFSSGTSMFQGNYTSAGDMPPLSQCLMLDPITMGDQKFTCLGELRRVLGISYGTTLEDCSFEGTNLKPPPSVATEELKRFKASMLDASNKARGRSKRLDESLQKLNKYCEALNSKKQPRNKILMNERLGGSNLLKMGSLIHRNSSEVVNQRLEDRAKNIILNKHFRTSVTENRLDGQSSNFLRQPLVHGKDRDTLRDGGEHCDIFEEKICRLPAGGETWDRKMKRKRSIGTVFPRPIDGEGEMRRIAHLKRTNESDLQSSDAQGLRSGSSGSNRKLDVNSLSASSNPCATANDEHEKISRDSSDASNKECVVLKGNKFNVHDNNYIGGVYSLTKGKASRATRPLMASCASRSSGTLEDWEQPSNVSKPHSISGTGNRKRPLPSGSSSPTMAQWVGQRPQKISRTRRANVIYPILNCDEVHVSLEGCSPSDAGPRMAATATSGSHAKVAISGNQQGTMKHEDVSSPARFSESEEYGAGENGENKLKDKELVTSGVDERVINNSHNVSSLVLKKNKLPNKEEIGDGLQRQGRSGRGLSICRVNTPPMKEKLETRTLTKPLKSMKPASEKNGRSGRPPLKKLSDRKAVARPGHPSTGNSPDFGGELDDDHEELLAAANFASNASYLCCYSSFWKGLESIFAPVRLEDIAYLKEQVKSIEDDYRFLSRMSGLGSDNLDGLAHKDYLLSQCTLTGGKRSTLDKIDSNELSSMVDMVDQHLDISYLCRVDTERNVAPLYQRVLTALIVEEDKTDKEETVGESNVSLCKGDDSLGLACFSQDAEHKYGIRTELESESELSPKARDHCALGKIHCNGHSKNFSCTNIHDQLLDDLLQVHHGPSPPETECSPLSENGSYGILAVHTDNCSSFNCQFEQMNLENRLLLELHSVGVYPETVPDLADRDSEAITQDIVQLQKGLQQQVRKKGEYLMKFIQTVEDGREMEQRSLEQVAMDKVVEFAYKKKLATRGSSAARNGLPKVSKQVAMAFMKRTLARCRTFEESGRSCFMEPVLKDVLFAAPNCDSYACSPGAGRLPLSEDSWRESVLSGLFASREQYSVCSDKTDNGPVDVSGNLNHPSDLDFARTGPIINRGKKKELLLDDVGASASLRSASTLANSLIGGVKGKRSERERAKDTSGRNSIAKVSRPSASYSRVERKTKAKPKQKIAPVSTSGNGFYGKLTDATNLEHQLASGSSDVNANSTNRKDKVESISLGYSPKDLSKEIEEPIDFTKLNELDLANELGGNQDLGSWLNIDEDGLQDHDAMGLEIPMDDLSELNMLL